MNLQKIIERTVLAAYHELFRLAETRAGSRLFTDFLLLSVAPAPDWHGWLTSVIQTTSQGTKVPLFRW